VIYRVRVERKAQRKLSKIPEPYYSNLKAAILDLGKDPRPQGYIKLKGKEAFRIRVANYRIIYEIQDSVLLVDVIDLGHRKDIY
jgi:mRNA interferase RelE/StbE